MHEGAVLEESNTVQYLSSSLHVFATLSVVFCTFSA